MYHGHYFRLDTGTACVEKGITVFRYCPDGKTDSDIYATFTDDEIEFHSIGGDPDRSSMILHIPIDDDMERSFANTVTESFHRKVEETAADPMELAHLSYYSAYYFGQDSKHLKYRKKPRGPGASHGSPAIPEPLAIRKLILDFFFDLRETDLFRISPHCDGLNDKLNQNFFARCLLAKARYWYQRAICEEALREGKEASDAAERQKRETKRQFYGKILFKAEREWACCLRDHRVDRIFHEEFYEWFDDSETEMRRIYTPYLTVRPPKGILRDMRKEHNQLVSRWFVARYTGLTAWRVLLAGHASFFGLHLFLPRLVLAITAAWFTLVFFQEFNLSLKGHSLAFYVLILAFMIAVVSMIVVQRTVPYAENIPTRALKLSGLVVLFSGLAGCVLLNIRDFSHNFVFLAFSAAFIGLVLNIFLQGDNPGDSL